MHGKIFLIFGFFFVFRYCINSCSMEFLPETEVDGSVKKEDAEEIHHPATLGGCSSDGTCRLPPKSPRTAVRDRIEIRANFLDTSSYYWRDNSRKRISNCPQSLPKGITLEATFLS